MFKYIAIILITVSLFCSCAQQKETTSAIPVILDTDVGNDIDDVLAMQMLLNYEKKGKIEAIIIPKGRGICNLFCEDGEYIIPFACIKRIGPDIILVEMHEEK